MASEYAFDEEEYLGLSELDLNSDDFTPVNDFYQSQTDWMSNTDLSELTNVLPL